MLLAASFYLSSASVPVIDVLLIYTGTMARRGD